MQTPYDLSDSFQSQVRTKIGEALRTLYVPKEPLPKRLLELLHALDDGDDNVTEENDSGSKPGC